MKALETSHSFYLVHKEKIIVVEETISIARKHGNVVIHYDPSTNATQCQIGSLKSVSTKDAISNDVKINHDTLLVGISMQIKAGDVLKIGADEYIYYESIDEAEKKIPRWEKRKYKRPKNAYSPMNFLNFYSAPPWALSIYIIAFAYAISRFFSGLHIEAPIHLDFLTQYHNQNILRNTLAILVITWALCLFHSFLMYLYFNRTAPRRFFSSLVFIFITFSLIYYISRPLDEIRNYLTTREKIQNLRADPLEKVISHITNLTDFKNSLTKSFKFISASFSQGEQRKLTQDFDANVGKIDRELKIDYSGKKQAGQ